MRVQQISKAQFLLTRSSIPLGRPKLRLKSLEIEFASSDFNATRVQAVIA
jgi:hypothetical protein